MSPLEQALTTKRYLFHLHQIPFPSLYTNPSLSSPNTHLNVHLTLVILSHTLMDPRLYSVARLGSLAALNSLLEEDPLLLEKVALSSSADTPLHIATLAANTDFAKEMLLRMPNFAWELNQDGFSPLHIAAAMGNIEITRELLSLDSGLCLVKDKVGRTPLHCAAIKGRVKIAGELLSHCYEAVKEVSDGGKTALHLAVKNSQFEVLKVLVEKLGEDDRDRLINARDDQGHTVLKLAVAMGQVQVTITSIFYFYFLW